ncbi:MAG: flagellar export chaperone FliS [Acidobacteria bacterium]|nr:MAG: flagellar export chaperone FliS [Acidobacteriota bacterium]
MSYALSAERARAAYQANTVRDDDPLGLVVKLYDGMLGFLRRGSELLEESRYREAAEPIRRATDIVGELQAVLDLDRGGEVAANLDRLYTYARRRIVEAHLGSDPAGLREVADLLQPLRDAWAEAREKTLAAGVR